LALAGVFSRLGYAPGSVLAGWFRKPPPALVRSGLGNPSSRIEHLVIVMLENHSFDSYFGRYCKAPTGSEPTCVTGPECCEAAPETEPGAHANPVALTDSENGAFDPIHFSKCIEAGIHGGRMDGYVSTDVPGCGNPRNFAIAGLPEMRTYWDLASQYAMADRFFHPFAGASSANDMYYARAAYVFDDNEYGPPVLGRTCIDEKTRSYHDSTVAHLLIAAGVSWAVYIEGYLAMREATAKGLKCPAPPAECPAKSDAYPCTYDPSDIPFAYYPSLDLDHGPGRDFGNFAEDLSAGSLPAVSWVRPLGYKTEHPGDGTRITDGADFVRELFGKLTASKYAENTLLLITYDEGGGYFDHVPPPQAGPFDGKPYGVRVPFLALGNFARKNHVSHEVMEHSSIVRFIEWNWLGKRTGQLGTRDALVNNIGSLLDPERTGTPVP
jgi:phospholipase C